MENRPASVGTGMNRFYARIYGFLALGIGISALVSFVVLNVFWREMYFNPGLFYVAWIAELILVVALGRKGLREPRFAVGGFIAYAILNGITLSFTLLVYANSSIVPAFICTAATFVGMSVIGVTTKRDLSAWRHALYSCLIGIILAILLNVFLLRSQPADLLISILSIVLFSGFTVYDNQRIKQVYASSPAEPDNGLAIYLALQLYLNVINLFINFIRLTSRK